MAWIEPIWDRTFNDILNKTPKGYYNAVDFNRIESNCIELATMLGVTITTKTNWDMTDLPTVSQFKRIVDNVALLRANYHVYESCPQNPQHPVNNFNKANALERIMYDIHKIFNENKENYYYTGEIYAGDDIGGI